MDNPCYNNPVFPKQEKLNLQPDILPGQKENEENSFSNLPTKSNIIPCKTKIKVAICKFESLKNVRKYDSSIKIIYFVSCIAIIILLSNAISSRNSNGSEGLICNVYGNGQDVYFYHTQFGDLKGNRMDRDFEEQSSLSCKDGSACIKIHTTIGEGRKQLLDDWNEDLKKNNDTLERYMKRGKFWLGPFLPGTIKGCIQGSGHSWTRNECHSFNSSVWDFERFQKRYNANWFFTKSCVCAQNNCN